MTDAIETEVMLLRWGESNSSGRTVTFQLPEDTPYHPFRGVPSGAKNGQRYNMRLHPLAPDETETIETAAQREAQRAVARASMLAKDPQFERYLALRWDKVWTYACANHEGPEQRARGAIRQICGIGSLSQLVDSNDARSRLASLGADYDEWAGRRAEER